MLDVRTILKIKKPFLGALKQYSKCYNIIWNLNRIPFMFVKLLFSRILFMRAWNNKWLFVLLQYITSQLSSVSLTTSLYQVRMILVFLGTINAEGKLWLEIYLHNQRWQGFHFQSLFDTLWSEYRACLFRWICHTFHAPISSEGSKSLLIKQNNSLIPGWQLLYY